MKQKVTRLKTASRLVRLLTRGGLAALAACSPALVGCVNINGSQQTHSNFVYPNSNVVKLGPTKASASRASIIFPPGFSAKRIKQVHEEALAKVQGANVILDYKQDTVFTMIPIPYIPIFFLNYSVEGTAARQTVGMKTLH